MGGDGAVRRYALIGAAGFVAPRHLRAIKDTGGELVAALDKSDSVGILDSYFPHAHFFTEFERFDRHLDKLRRAGKGIDYLTVCSPNYLHDSHVRFGLRAGAHVICEKPLVLNPWNVLALSELERETHRCVNCILQLRLHPKIIALREQVLSAERSAPYAVEMVYTASRGRWYDASWKGDVSKSGGTATNIGIHFFDMLTWIFGAVLASRVFPSPTGSAEHGELELERAHVRWSLSTKGESRRSITVDGHEVEFSDGMKDLHTVSYEEILAGRGFRPLETLTAVQLVHDIRTAAKETL